MNVFDLSKILNSENKVVISPLKKSKIEFLNSFKDNIIISKDGMTTIGFQTNENEQIFLEDLSNSEKIEILYYYKHSSYINSIYFNEDHGLLYLGYGNSDLAEFKMTISNRFCKLKKIYRNLDIGEIFSICQKGQFLFVGGRKKIKIIDTKLQKVKGVIEPAIFFVSSLEICEISKSKIYLCVFGSYFDYFKKTDYFDISNLFADS